MKTYSGILPIWSNGCVSEGKANESLVNHRRTKEQDWQREPEVAGRSYRSRVLLATENYAKLS